MAEPKRVHAALDDVSGHLGDVLRRADELLAEWSAFGASVRNQVEREARTIGDAVAGAVDGAVARATASGIDRAMADHVGAKLAALTAELTTLEARARSASRSITEARTGDRRVMWIVAIGVLVANALLVAILVRDPASPPVAVVAPEPIEVTVPVDPGLPAVVPSDAAGEVAVGSGSAATGDLGGSVDPSAGSATTAVEGAAGAGSAAPPQPAIPDAKRPAGHGVKAPAPATPSPKSPAIQGAKAPAVRPVGAKGVLPPRRK